MNKNTPKIIDLYPGVGCLSLGAVFIIKDRTIKEFF